MIQSTGSMHRIQAQILGSFGDTIVLYTDELMDDNVVKVIKGKHDSLFQAHTLCPEDDIDYYMEVTGVAIEQYKQLKNFQKEYEFAEETNLFVEEFGKKCEAMKQRVDREMKKIIWHQRFKHAFWMSYWNRLFR